MKKLIIFRRYKTKAQEVSTARQDNREEAVHNEYNSSDIEGTEMGHYATVRSVSPLAVEKEPTSETQYATLGFKETADLRNGNVQFPLNVL